METQLKEETCGLTGEVDVDRDSATQDAEGERIKEAVIEALRTVYDPEIPVNIFDLGLVYAIDIDLGSGEVAIDMTLTAPACPMAEMIPLMVRDAVCSVEGVEETYVNLVWDPPWSPENMSEDAKLMLGIG